MKKAIAIILLLAVSISLLGCGYHKDDTSEEYTSKTTIKQMISEFAECYFLDIFAVEFGFDDEVANEILGEFIDDCQIEEDENGVEFKRTYTPYKDEELICELVKRKNAMKISWDHGKIECKYNENGKLIHCTTSSGVTYEFSYNDNGKCKSSTITNEEEGYVTEKFYGVEGPFASRTYNADGVVVEIVEYGKDRSKERTKYLSDQYYIEEYDYDGNLIKTTSYADDGSVIEREEAEYDESGNKIKWLVYSADGSITKWEESEYDEDGNETKWLSCADDGSITEWKEYEYDEDGNKTKCSEYASDGSLTGWEEYEYDGVIQKTIVYDSDGRIIDEHDTEAMWAFSSALTFGLMSPATMEAWDNVDFMPDASESIVFYFLVWCVQEGLSI